MRRYIIACLVAISAAQFGSITIDWNQGVPEVNFAGYDDGGGTHLEHVELTNEAAPFDDVQTEFEEAEAEASPPSIEDTPPDEVYETEYLDGHQRIHEPPELLNKQDTATASRSDLQALEQLEPSDLVSALRRLGKEVPSQLNIAELRRSMRDALQRARTKTLRTLLREHGEECKGCTEKEEFVAAAAHALTKPLKGKLALPLFVLEGHHLYPHSQVRLHLFEPRYTLMVRRALRSDWQFGIVSADGIGTLANIESAELLEGGRFSIVASGSQRFRLGRQWAEECDGCPYPLAHSDVNFFNDTAAASNEDEARALAEEALRRYNQLTQKVEEHSGATVHQQLEELLGPMPNLHGPRGAYAVSMWLSGACRSLPACAPYAEGFLRGRSTTARLKQVLAFQAALEESQQEDGERRRKARRAVTRSA